MVTAKLICIFVFAYAKKWSPLDKAQLNKYVISISWQDSLHGHAAISVFHLFKELKLACIFSETPSVLKICIFDNMLILYVHAVKLNKIETCCNSIVTVAILKKMFVCHAPTYQFQIGK